jgi:hypothetical protein
MASDGVLCCTESKRTVAIGTCMAMSCLELLIFLQAGWSDYVYFSLFLLLFIIYVQKNMQKGCRDGNEHRGVTNSLSRTEAGVISGIPRKTLFDCECTKFKNKGKVF